MKRTLFLLLVLLGAMTTVPTTQARHQVELESTYLGEGWFRYTLRSIDDPFFRVFNLSAFTFHSGSFEEVGAVPSEWTSELFTNSAGMGVVWNYSLPATPQSRPYERIFLVRSPHRSFKRVYNALFGMSFSALGWPSGLAGYATLHSLTPCAPEEADASPTNLLERFTLINLPDIRMDDLVRSGGDILGFSFTYPNPSTVLLQGSTDFRSWTNVGYLHGDAGRTTFQSASPLNRFGNFFRVLLAAEGHVPLTPSGQAMATAPKSQVLSSGTPPLQLGMNDSGTVTVSWPVSDAGYTLESAAGFPSPDWQAVAMSPVILSNRWVVTNSFGAGNHLFRLRKN